MELKTKIEPARAETGSLYWTLSLPVEIGAEGRLSRSQQIVLVNKLSTQKTTQSLRAAMNPMFHDVADQTNTSESGEFLAATPQQRARHILLSLGDGQSGTDCALTWLAEGTICSVHLGPPNVKAISLRRFWYIQNDGSVSYHLSFALTRYAHSLADFFFISMLQKLAAPSEFELSVSPAGGQSGAPSWENQNVFPFRAFSVKSNAGGITQTESFWGFVKNCFTRDAAELLEEFGDGAKLPTHPYLGPSGAHLPQSRSIFSFKDRTLFELLLPKKEEKPVPRHDVIFDRDYRLISEVIRKLTVNGRTILDRGFQGWLENGQSVPVEGQLAIAVQRDAKIEQLIANDNVRMQSWPGFRRDRLRYLFMAGFNQNVIDFLNQDASEVLDSLDPIYPTFDEEVAERFFVRYANPRALISYAKTWRSLDIGARYIGNCPYIFLIHVRSMHNEIIADKFEMEATSLIDEAAQWHDKGQLARASDKFYEFRIYDHLNYERSYLDNNFRYNTEREFFEAVQDIRGVTRKHARIGNLLALLEQQTHSTESRISGRNGYILNGMVAALATFTVSTALHDWSVSVPKALHKAIEGLPLFLSVFSSILGGLGVVLFVLLMGFLTRLLWRWARSQWPVWIARLVGFLQQLR